MLLLLLLLLLQIQNPVFTYILRESKEVTLPLVLAKPGLLRRSLTSCDTKLDRYNLECWL